MSNQICTVTILPTMKVTRAFIGGRVMNLREGTTDVNALNQIRPYVRSRAYTWVFAGTRENAIVIVVAARQRRNGESLTAAFDRASKTAEKRAHRFGGCIRPMESK
jgi:uncharacterized protein (DUF2336 family)